MYICKITYVTSLYIQSIHYFFPCQAEETCVMYIEPKQKSNILGKSHFLHVISCYKQQFVFQKHFSTKLQLVVLGLLWYHRNFLSNSVNPFSYTEIQYCKFCMLPLVYFSNSARENVVFLFLFAFSSRRNNINVLVDIHI